MKKTVASASGITATTLLGCAAGALVCLALRPWAVDRIDAAPTALRTPSLLLAYLLAVALVQICGLLAFRGRYADEPGLDLGTRRIWLSMTGGALLSLALAMSIAAATDYGTSVGTVLTEVGVVLLCLGLSVFAGATWWLDLREGRRVKALQG